MNYVIVPRSVGQDEAPDAALPPEPPDRYFGPRTFWRPVAITAVGTLASNLATIAVVGLVGALGFQYLSEQLNR